MRPPVKVTASIFFVSLLGIPASYIVNTAHTTQGEVGLFAAGILCLAAICVLTYVALVSFKQPKDWLFYVFTLCTFSSVIDIIVGLEADGYVSGFMTNYLKNGEPYLATPYGSVTAYWDGTVHYALYLFMLAAMACRWNYRSLGLYWVGSIVNSLLVFLPAGAFLGKHGVRWSFLLNVPYIIIPVVSAVRFLRQRDSPRNLADKSLVVTSGRLGALCRRPVDLLFIIAMIFSAFLAFLRGFAVLGCPSDVTLYYIKRVEPYLQEPAAFPKAQMLVYMYYFVPFYVMGICSLLVPGCSAMPDWALVFAGAAAQGQTTHVVTSFHRRTLAQYHVPGDAYSVFLLINVFLLLVIPHLFALRCCCFPAFFQQTSDTSAERVQRKSE